jgi:peroxiredoxin
MLGAVRRLSLRDRTSFRGAKGDNGTRASEHPPMVRNIGFWLSMGFAAAACLPIASPPTNAGKFNRKISLGDAAPSYAGLPGVDGKTHSLADLKDKEVVVLAITCNHCPVATAYEKRIIDFANKYAGPGSKVALVAINVNTDTEDALPAMIVRAKESGFNFPYLYDESQKIGRALGASVTPEFFVLNKDRKIVYMGGMDNGVNPNNVTETYLAPAVDAVLKGSAPAIGETAARGCNILYRRVTK